MDAPCVCVLGYYGESNLGDEMFKKAIPIVLQGCTLSFHHMRKIPPNINDFDAIVLGGGDILNDYFFRGLSKALRSFRGPVICLGMGIPYEGLIHSKYLDIADHVFIREKTDLRQLQKRLGSQYVHFLPDLGFAIPHGRMTYHRRKKRVGVFIAQPLYRYQPVAKSIRMFLSSIAKQGYDLNLYRFNSCGREASDDSFASTCIGEHCRANVDNSPYCCRTMINVMESLDYAICVRFHAHIFCMMKRIPFISIAATRKTRLLMQENGLMDYRVEVDTDDNMVPVSLDVNKCQQSFDLMVKNTTSYIHTLSNIDKKFSFLWETNQVRNIIMSRDIRPKDRTYIDRVDIDYVVRRAESLLDGKELTRELAVTTAKKLCFWVTNEPGSKYVHGTISNIMERRDIKGLANWIYNDYSSKVKGINGGFCLTYVSQNSMKGLHRAGWDYVTNALMELHTDSGIILDTYLDRTFGWAKDEMMSTGVIPYTSPWAGFVHHTPNTEYTEYNNINMLRDRDFLRSLENCYGLYVLSEYLARWWRRELSRRGYEIKVEALTHPTDPKCEKWSWRKFSNNKDRMLINVGAWYRDPFCINTITVDGWIKKASLRGKAMSNYFCPKEYIIAKDGTFFPPNSKDNTTGFECRSDGNKYLEYMRKYVMYLLRRPKFSMILRDCDDVIIDSTKEYPSDSPRGKLKAVIESLISSVEIIDTLSNDEYDKLLSSNVVFLRLISCSAVNTIIECIMRETPFIVNRMPSIVELIGNDYPLFYNKVEDVTGLLTSNNVLKAHNYLHGVSKERLSATFMIESIKSGVIYNYD